MKVFRIGLLSVGLLATPGAVHAQVKPEVAFRAAMETEVVKGDLKGAIEQYKKVAQSRDRAVAAKALVRLADCHMKLGDAEARHILQRVVREYGDQSESSAEARKRLAAIDGPRTGTTLAKRRLCDDCGDNEADISPDGRWMAITEWDETGDLAVKDMSTGEIKRLMAKSGTWKTAEAYVETPVFSPDLRQIAYLYWTGSDGHAQLRVMPNEVSGKHRVLVDDPANHYYSVAGWSPDGKRILVTIQKVDRTRTMAWVSAVDGTLTPLKSLEWRLPTPGVNRPQISRDGRYIAYSALALNPRSAMPPPERRHQNIYIIAADGSSEVELVKSAGINRNPIWTPDGANLLFTSDRTGSFGLWSVPVQNGRATGNPKLVSPEIGAIDAIGLTRSGTYYYAQSHRLEMAGIVNMANPAPPVGTFVGIRPMWSPDGSMLGFTRRRGPSSADQYEFVVQSVVTGEETVYAYPGIRPAPAKWLSGGNAVLVMVIPPGQKSTWCRLDLKTKEFKPVFEFDPAELAAGQAALSADEKTLYVAGRSAGTPPTPLDRIVAVDLETGRQRQTIAVPPTGPISFQLSPDGQMFAIRRQNSKESKMHFAVVGVDGTGMRELYAESTVEGLGAFDVLEWTRDGRALLFETRKDNAWMLMRLSLNGGAPQFTGFQAAGLLQSVDLSPDGSQLAFGHRTNIHELWALDNVLAAAK